MATVEDVLALKGPEVFTVARNATVLEATRLMNQRRIGALVVTTGPEAPHGPGGRGRVAGVITERDVLTRLVAQQRDAARTLVEEIMTADVAYCAPQTDLDHVAQIMRQRRIRHLPVCDEDGTLRGLVSIGDVNAWHTQRQEQAIEHLKDYIQGRT